MKVNLLDLSFNVEHLYVQQKSIVEKITFNNRTFYSKYQKLTTPLNSVLLAQHQNKEITLALPLVANNATNYIVIEYYQDDWESFYALLRYLLKSLNIIDFQAYKDPQRDLFQLFIQKQELNLEIAYKEVQEIKHLLNLKNKKGYKIYPNQNLPKNFNIITLPSQKI